MNKIWSEQNKTMQAQLKKEETFEAGLDTLFELRNELMSIFLSLKEELPDEAFAAMPFRNADGNHSVSIAWSLWHIFRIEDIVSHTLISDDDQIFFRGSYQKKMHSPIITTANELDKDQIEEFSKQLDLDGLFAYITEVKESSERILKGLKFKDLKQKVSEEAKDKLLALNVVSKHEDSFWLIDYWCGKDIRGLIQMPFSRHWIMHAEAVLKIKNKVCQKN